MHSIWYPCLIRWFWSFLRGISWKCVGLFPPPTQQTWHENFRVDARPICSCMVCCIWIRIKPHSWRGQKKSGYVISQCHLCSNIGGVGVSRHHCSSSIHGLFSINIPNSFGCSYADRLGIGWLVWYCSFAPYDWKDSKRWEFRQCTESVLGSIDIHVDIRVHRCSSLHPYRNDLLIYFESYDLQFRGSSWYGVHAATTKPPPANGVQLPISIHSIGAPCFGTHTFFLCPFPMDSIARRAIVFHTNKPCSVEFLFWIWCGGLFL